MTEQQALQAKATSISKDVSRLLEDQERTNAIELAKLVARREFRKRGNHTEAHLSEGKLAEAIAIGIELDRQVNSTAHLNSSKSIDIQENNSHDRR